MLNLFKGKKSPSSAEQDASQRAAASGQRTVGNDPGHSPFQPIDLGQVASGPSGQLPTTSIPDHPDQRVATFDRFGPTLVATVVLRAISGNDAQRLIEELATELHTGMPPSQHVVVDLQNVEFMDSACIGALVDLLTRLQRAGGRIALVNADPNVEYLFKLTRLDRLFPICRDVMKAVEVVQRAA